MARVCHLGEQPTQLFPPLNGIDWHLHYSSGADRQSATTAAMLEYACLSSIAMTLLCQAHDPRRTHCSSSWTICCRSDCLALSGAGPIAAALSHTPISLALGRRQLEHTALLPSIPTERWRSRIRRTYPAEEFTALGHMVRVVTEPYWQTYRDALHDCAATRPANWSSIR
jgi:hypothetical protein